jgi:hypothetical protein
MDAAPFSRALARHGDFSIYLSIVWLALSLAETRCQNFRSVSSYLVLIHQLTIYCIGSYSSGR